MQHSPVYLLEGSTVVARVPLLPGQQGTEQTLRMMRELVNQGGRDVKVRDMALSILRAAGVRAQDYAGELAAFYRFVRDRIRYTRDPVGVELLQKPRRTLELGAGDCDDHATLLAALLRATGNPAELQLQPLQLRAIGVDPRQPRKFSHVYLVARLGRRRVALDPNFEGLPAGWEFPRATIATELAL